MQKRQFLAAKVPLLALEDIRNKAKYPHKLLLYGILAKAMCFFDYSNWKYFYLITSKNKSVKTNKKI